VGFSIAVRNEMLDWWFGNAQSGYLPPENIYVGLVNEDDNEVSGDNYSRVQTDVNDWSHADEAEIVNINPLTFPDPVGDWGVIDRVRLYDAFTDGTELAEGDITEPVEVVGSSGGVTPEFIEGRFTIKLTGDFSETIRNEMLDWWFGNAQSGYLPPEDLFIALIKTDSSEVYSGSYGRVQTDVNDWSHADDGEVTNINPITFLIPTADWGLVSKVRLYDQSSGGDILAEGFNTTGSILILAGGTAPEFVNGTFDLRLI